MNGLEIIKQKIKQEIMDVKKDCSEMGINADFQEGVELSLETVPEWIEQIEEQEKQTI